MKVAYTHRKSIRILLTVAALAISLSIAHLTNAQSPSATGAPTQIREHVQERAAEVKESMEQKRAQIAVRTQERIINLGRNVEGRMQSALRRLTNITTRMEARMNILESRGANVDEARLSLEAAGFLLEDVEAALATLDGDLISTVESETPREAFSSLRTQFQETKNGLLAAHQQLRETLTLMKAAVGEAELERGVSDAVSNENGYGAQEETPDAENTEDTE